MNRRLTSFVCGLWLLAWAAAAQPAFVLVTGLRWSFNEWVVRHPDTLEAQLWSSYQTATNGHDEGYIGSWGSNGTNLTWNTNSVIYGLTGFTAISPWCSINGPQIQRTALTKRHLYSRGHDRGEVDQLSTNGEVISFYSTNNVRFTATEIARITRLGSQGDYTISLLDQDLPSWVSPMRILRADQFAALMTNGYYPPAGVNNSQGLLLGTCQHGYVGFACCSSIFTGHSMWIAGDSGAPNFYLLNRELFFVSGRSTSAWNTNMLADMNTLTAWAGLSTNNYQPQFLGE
jgi:hypothetical protein